MVAICVSDMLCDWVSGARERVEPVEKGRKKREKSVEAVGAAKDIRNSSGDVLVKKWRVSGFACVSEGRGSAFTLELLGSEVMLKKDK